MGAGIVCLVMVGQKYAKIYGPDGYKYTFQDLSRKKKIYYLVFTVMVLDDWCEAR